MAKVTLHLTGDKDADAVISRDPLALLIGMVLDQQVTMEKAFSAPSELARRLGGDLHAAGIATMDPDEFALLFKEKPALHRFPGSMAGRVQEVCRIVADEYGGRADTIWKDLPDGATLVNRLTALPGFGQQKARIFAALLGKQLGIQPSGWRAAASPFAEMDTHLSLADITDAESSVKVRSHKKAMKARARAGK
ncbi:MAG TPA: HhH-GPD-type base excision DNA repair protein [Acidimicrobiales bacterium]|nr:HhH-GPD-type base excision DNA repair protein [Acidimicrobiales bacterium]